MRWWRLSNSGGMGRSQSGQIFQSVSDLDIGHQSVHPPFAPETAFEVASERAGRIKFIEGVTPAYSGLDLVCDLENLTALVGPDSRSETVAGVICPAHGFGRRAESENTQNGSENFLASDAVARTDVGEKRRAAPVAGVRQGTARLVQRRAFINSGTD